jgi:branched-chain amino acid transport system ATP-binding protein
MLKVNEIHTSYGAIKALHGVYMEINIGELVCVIGANGAGKSTLMKSIIGLTPVEEGKIIFEGQDITRLKTYKIAQKGISLVPEGRLLFSDLSVMENLIMGSYTRPQKEMKGELSTIFELFPRLQERIKQKAGTLSGGEQQMLAIARALMSNPRLLVLDEPSLGLAPRVVSDIFDTISRLNKENKLTILLVEQNANMAFSIASRGYVMKTGKILVEGTTAELRENSDVKTAYLGSRSNKASINSSQNQSPAAYSVKSV